MEPRLYTRQLSPLNPVSIGVPYSLCRSLFGGQDRVSGFRHQASEENVRIEVFAHAALGEEAVFVASLSNSVLLVMRTGSEREEDDSSLHSWLLDWPVQGKVGFGRISGALREEIMSGEEGG